MGSSLISDSWKLPKQQNKMGNLRLTHLVYRELTAHTTFLPLELLGCYENTNTNKQFLQKK
jgi:hypothetical protein